MLAENGVICSPREGMFYGFDAAPVIGRHAEGIERRERARGVLAVQQGRLDQQEAHVGVDRHPPTQLSHQLPRLLEMPRLAVLHRAVIQAGHQQATNVGGITRARANTAGIRIHQVASVLPGFIEHSQAGQPEHRRRDPSTARTSPGSQCECRDFQRRNDQEQVPGPLTPLLVHGHRRTHTGYALGWRIEYFDQPAIRTIAKSAEANSYKISSFILGVVKSDAFRMRRVEPEAATTDTTKASGR